jgi:arylsulfatase A-like enzyme/Flp pilus assembly protein TadD
VALAIGSAAWWWLAPSARQQAGNVDLGHLPRGVSREQLNLLVVTLDTTRADRVGAYGSQDVETPALDRLAAEGALFEQAMAVAPLTLPAHASIFTGRFPPEHGVRDNGGFVVGPSQTTLAEVLSERGFKTGGFVGAFVLDRKWGIAQGFQTYVDEFDPSETRGVALGNVQRPGNEVVDRALAWLEQAHAGRFFAWVHLYDPHFPYAPPEPFRSRYAARPYDGEVAFVDAQVGRLIEFLRAKRVLDRTVVAVMGDHGEMLGEHGENAHGFFVYEGATRVPFIVRAPFSNTRARRVTDVVRAVDLFPTVLELLDLPPARGVPGRSLLPLMTGAVRELGLEGYAEGMHTLHHYGWSDLRALRAGRYKLIDAPRPELYDLERDPGESTNLFGERRQVADGMLNRLRQLEAAFDRSSAAAPAVDVDPEARERLAALGYVSGFVATSADPRSDRADPKDKIAIFNKIGEARERANTAGAGAPQATADLIALLHEVVLEDPTVVEAWFLLGTQSFKLGRLDDAVKFFKKTLELKPDHDLAVTKLAGTYREMGNDEAAIAGFEHHLAQDPTDAYAHYELGEIHLARGNLSKADALFRKALALDRRVAQATVALGVISAKRGDLSGAERLVREALATRPDVALAHFNLGLIAEARGDTRTAEAEYRDELKRHPESYQAAFNLALLYESTGRRQQQIEALRQSIEGNPRFAEGHFLLAKAYLDSGGDLAEAGRLAQKGLELAPRSPMAPVGRQVMAAAARR